MASEVNDPKLNPADPETESNPSRENDNKATPFLRAETQIPPSAIDTNSFSQEKEYRLNRKRFWVEILTLVAIVVYACITYRMLEEMRGTGQQTNKLIEQATKQAQAAKESADAAKTTIEIIQKNIQLDQRAWVGPIGVNKPDIKPGSKFVVEVMATNSGKTPALKFQFTIGHRAIPKNQPFTPAYQQPATPKGSISVIQPGGRAAMPTIPMELTQAQIDIIKSGSLIYYFFGKFTYEDIFRHLRNGNFCFYLQPDLSTMSFCDSYNNAN